MAATLSLPVLIKTTDQNETHMKGLTGLTSFIDSNDTFRCSFSQWPYSKAVVEAEVPSHKKILNKTAQRLQKIQARPSLPKLALPRQKFTTFNGLVKQSKLSTLHGIELGRYISWVGKRAGVTSTVNKGAASVPCHSFSTNIMRRCYD